MFLLTVLGCHLRPVRRLEVLHGLGEVGQLLLQLQVGPLQVGDLGDEGVDAGPGLLQLLGRRGVGAALIRQLGLEVAHPLVIQLGEVVPVLLHLLVVDGAQLLQGLLEPENKEHSCY